MEQELMPILIVIMMLALPSLCWSSSMIECERFEVNNIGEKKSAVTKFTLSLDTIHNKILYKNLNGPNWVFFNDIALDILWISQDRKRVVSIYKDVAYEIDDSSWYPIYIMDIDFEKPKYKISTFGGFSDFAELTREKEKALCS